MVVSIGLRVSGYALSGVMYIPFSQHLRLSRQDAAPTTKIGCRWKNPNLYKREVGVVSTRLSRSALSSRPRCSSQASHDAYAPLSICGMLAEYILK